MKDRSNPQDPSVLLTAPTGTAAFTVGGYTIHSALKVPRKLPSCPSEMKDLAPDQANTLQVKLANLQLLIIDEVSMVNRRVFHCIHKRLRQIKRIPISDKTAYFGNVAILAVGDMYQLLPVKAHPLVIPDQKQGIDMWHDLFTLVELDEIMRQKHDQTFAEALNRLRTHKKGDPLNPADELLLQTRNNRNDIPPDALHVFATNAQTDHHNNNMLNLRCETSTTLQAIDYTKDKTSGKMMRAHASNKATNDDLPSLLHLGINARVILTKEY